MVSVIIPVYNVAPYLREALDSVIQQSYSTLQIIIIDDGSTDGSGAICDEYLMDPRTEVIHQNNCGLSHARNVGLDCAEGDYIAFLDPDDAYHPDFIHNCLKAMIDADIAVCRYAVCHTNDRMKLGGEIGLKNAEGVYNRNDALCALVASELNFAVWNKLYKRELWENIRFPDGRNYEDIDVMYRIFDRCNAVAVVSQPMYFYRKRSGGISATITLRNIVDKTISFSHMEEYVKSNIPDIFNLNLLIKVQQTWIDGMMYDYAMAKTDAGLLDEIREEIIRTGKKVNLGRCSIRTIVAYQMIQYCPWLLRMIYPVYSPIRLLVLRAWGHLIRKRTSNKEWERSSGR